MNPVIKAITRPEFEDGLRTGVLPKGVGSIPNLFGVQASLWGVGLWVVM